MQTLFSRSASKSEFCLKNSNMDQTSVKKKELARIIYTIGNYTFEEVAEKVGVKRQTVGRWAKADNWKELKAGMSITKDNILKNMYRHLNEINEEILKRDEKNRIPTTAEADVMVKLSAAIKNMELDIGLADIIGVGMKFGNWMRGLNVDKAKEFMEYWDMFINEYCR